MKNYKQNDLKEMIAKFQNANTPTDRYASFDYCYHYFRKSSSDIVNNIEMSCLTIGFYLASWGMLRGSSFLLNKSAKYYEPLVGYIAGLDKEIWNIDVDSYSNENIELICEIYDNIKEIIVENGKAHLTLVTKIMLGVFGFIPAFDNYFGNTFRDIFNGKCGFRSVNDNSLSCIRKFYDDNKREIDSYSKKIFVFDFVSGKKTKVRYPKSKIIDMYGFTKGLE
jgi:hypothetical protein